MLFAIFAATTLPALAKSGGRHDVASRDCQVPPSKRWPVQKSYHSTPRWQPHRAFAAAPCDHGSGQQRRAHHHFIAFCVAPAVVGKIAKGRPDRRLIIAMVFHHQAQLDRLVQRLNELIVGKPAGPLKQREFKFVADCRGDGEREPGV